MSKENTKLRITLTIGKKKKKNLKCVPVHHGNIKDFSTIDK